MRVRALFFGQLREIVGAEEQEAELPSGACMREAFALWQQRFPALAPFQSMVIAARNQEYAPWDTALEDGDEIAFLPPVSGGSFSSTNRTAGEDNANCGAEAGAEACQLLREPIPVAKWVAFVKGAEDGAVAAFEGIVRNHSCGRAILYLEYEAYAPMALAKMREIAAQAREKFVIHRVAIIHRLGRLEIGETSVLIAISAAHRAAAFDACRFAIDTLKHTVPIWKKEFFADGSAWAEGEVPACETPPAMVASKRP
jgi:molybdopterin converting factor subunit 1